MTEFLRMSGMYWGLTVMDLMNGLDSMDKQEVLDFVKQCQHESGGVSASIGHDPHLLYTLSAVQVGSIFERNVAIVLQSLLSKIVAAKPHKSRCQIPDQKGRTRAVLSCRK